MIIALLIFLYLQFHKLFCFLLVLCTIIPIVGLSSLSHRRYYHFSFIPIMTHPSLVASIVSSIHVASHYPFGHHRYSHLTIEVWLIACLCAHRLHLFLLTGDLRNEDAVLEWLIDDDNRELQDEIEDVNGRMLDKLVENSPLLVVYFYDEFEQCMECPEVLAALENIDHELDVFGIDFVKVNDQAAFERWRVNIVPALGFFRKKEAIYYDGDLVEHEKVLAWLTSDDIFELQDEIEEVNKKMLDKLLNEQDYIAVYFCKLTASKADLSYLPLL